jgi:hypothetical protein
MPLSPKTRISEIRRTLEHMRLAMIDSDTSAMTASLPQLESAARSLNELSAELQLSSARPAIRREVSALQSELRRAMALVISGLEFAQRWSVTRSSAAGYLATGEAAPMEQSSTVLARG